MSIKTFVKRHWEKFLIAGVLAGFVCISKSSAMTSVYNEPMANETALAQNQTYVLNVNGYRGDYVSFQVIWGSATIPAVSFGDGQQSTMSITVVSATALTTATASDFMTVVATTGFSGSKITVGGISLTEGQQWSLDVNAASGTAISIKNAINSYVPNVVASTGSVSGKAWVVFTTSTYASFAANALTLVSNTSSITVNTANFTGGADNARIAINGVVLQANKDFGVGATSTTIAFALANAINANSSLNTIIVATAPLTGFTGPHAGVVIATSVINGVAQNYALFSSTQNALQLSIPVTAVGSGATGVMTGGLDLPYTFNGSNIVKANHQLTTGFQVLYTTSTNKTIAPLIWGTTYFAIPVDSGNFKLATTLVNAQAGTAITYTSSSTQTTADGFVLTPLVISGTPSYAYDASNDGVNWTRLTTPAGTAINTFVNPSTSTVTDVGLIDYSQIRVNVTGPTTGGVLFKVIPNLKTNK